MNISNKMTKPKSKKKSSQEWLDRQSKDRYVKDLGKFGYRSRSAFKLKQIDEKFHLFAPGQKVLDLGCSPGGWSQVIAKKVKPQKDSKSSIIAVDRTKMPPIPGVNFVNIDLEQDLARTKIREYLDGLADVIVSDMSPNTTGSNKTDHLQIMNLCELALDLALEFIKPRGSLVVKVFHGSDAPIFHRKLRTFFGNVHYFKPKASRKESPEIYLINQEFLEKR